MEVILTFQRNLWIKPIFKPHRSIRVKEKSQKTSFPFLICTGAAILKQKLKTPNTPGCVPHALPKPWKSLPTPWFTSRKNKRHFSPSSPTCGSHRSLKSTLKSLDFILCAMGSHWRSSAGVEHDQMNIFRRPFILTCGECTGGRQSCCRRPRAR